ncbi:MAG: 4'-phosphopantetheinyl transferase superfamily protein [Bacteroidales bacterium]|nr:4'-phosphopantetheinyl transferase superfamily protein [Bacteroidales bacterium]MBR4741268.1 4'-phosphopantetheinyl transferase superfamily protein [Bacteroidales bacterium]
MIYLNCHTEELDWEQALSRVSPQRREQALRYVKDSDRRQSLAAYLLLLQALEEEYGISDPVEFGFGPHGKPFLKDYPHIHFNLSHCPGASLCVLEASPVGCDIEGVPPVLDEDLCRWVCSDQEFAQIRQSARPTVAFTRLWTRKEAFLKFTGEGLTDHLKKLLLLPEAKAVSFETVEAPDGTWVYTVCRPIQTQRCH